jgi:diguanylate cyclase (GGDEF)-like protein
MLLTVGFGVTFIADLVYAGVQIATSDEGLPAWTDALYLMAFVALAAAVWTRSASAELSQRIQAVDERGVGRMIALAIGALTVPVVLIVLTAVAGAPGGVALAVGCVIILVLVLWRFQMVLNLVASQAQILDSLARTDALTGLPNRRTLDHELGRVTAEAALQGRPLTVAMLDLDHFKAFNDSRGHQAGDEALVACARVWREELDGHGFLGRYGGEEFAVLFSGVGQVRALPLLERLREATPSPHSVSIGVAERRPGETGFETMSRADRALYRAKENGRDQVVVDGA